MDVPKSMEIRIGMTEISPVQRSSPTPLQGCQCRKIEFNGYPYFFGGF